MKNKPMRTTSLLLLWLLGFGSMRAAAQEQPIPKWKVTDLQHYMDTTSVPTILNFWATFCKPCIAEIPHFQELAAQYKAQGVRLLLVSLDLPEDYKKIPEVARKRGIGAPLAYLDETNADLFCPRVDSSWTGALPATLLLNRASGYRHFIEAALSRTQLEAEIRKMLQ